MNKFVKRHACGAIVLSALFGAGVALAQSIPGLFIPSPTGSEQINVVNGGPQIATALLRQLRDASGYQIVQEAATNAVTVGNGASVIAFFGATAGTATVTTPVSPVDGQRLQIFSTAGVTTLTLTGSPGQTINNAAATIAANGNLEYIYQLSNTTWYRIQ